MVVELVTQNMITEFTDSIFEDNGASQIEHTYRVRDYSIGIFEGEKIENCSREFVELAALLHDIGIKDALKKHGSAAAPYQEKEGERVARRILTEISYDEKGLERICYIVGNHHTFSKIDGSDFQILWEADLLVNLEVMDIRKDFVKLKECIEKNFKTKTGKRLAEEKFLNKLAI